VLTSESAKAGECLRKRLRREIHGRFLITNLRGEEAVYGPAVPIVELTERRRIAPGALQERRVREARICTIRHT
jgi:hypothetical protein